MQISYCKTNHILVGLGGTGGRILKSFKMRMFEEFPDAADRDRQPVSLLYVDSTDEMMGIGRPDFRVMGMDASFNQNEFLNIKGVDVNHILDNIDNYPSVRAIVDNVSAVRTAIGSLGQAAGQKRRAGRLLFAANAAAYVLNLKNAYGRCEAISHNADKTNIHIFAGLCGGTGSGAIIDTIVQTRKTFPEAIISVYVMIPEQHLPKPNMDQGRYYQNGYAALVELNALQADRYHPNDITGAGAEVRFFTDKVKGVADGVTIYSNVNENGMTVDSLNELPKIVSDYVYARVFLIDSQDGTNDDIIRAYSFENMDDFALEFDETKDADASGKIPFSRTKKINSFGIKRVMYPELRVLRHMTYSIGESVLYQFKYNHWRENLGFVNEEVNKDYRSIYFNEENLSAWMLDESHLTLERKILPSDKDYPAFNEFWHDKSVMYSEDARKEENPLNELDSIMGDIYELQFRSVGVDEFYKGKAKAIPEMSSEIRRNIEKTLFKNWKEGDISIVELQKISKLLIERISETKKKFNEQIIKHREDLEGIEQDRSNNIYEWSQLGILQRMVNKGTRLFSKHQDILEEYYICSTRLVAFKFALELVARLYQDFCKLDVDISAFGQKINDSIEETERLIAAQRKVNRGLEDMQGATIEVSEEESMEDFEHELKINKNAMPNIAFQLRDVILPQSEFTTFGALASSISIDSVTDAFDLKLSQIIKTEHDEKVGSDKKVLGLNILTQLQQKLLTDEAIQNFAIEIVRQSGVYLRLNNDQMQLHVRNNEGNYSPSNSASINKKTILVSIPSPDENEGLKRFADKLEKAFRNSFSQGASQTSLVINMKSPRKDELSIITVAYCFPMRCISWLAEYKAKYDSFLHTGNPNTDKSNAILLHGEGDGTDFPSIFVQEYKGASAGKNMETPPTVSGTTPPPIQMPPVQNPSIQLYIAVSGKQYGPYSYQQCHQMVSSNQLTGRSLVWMQGMAAWTPASEVPELASLFSPEMPPAIDLPEGMPMPPSL